jgi:hypothetical protein
VVALAGSVVLASAAAAAVRVPTAALSSTGSPSSAPAATNLLPPATALLDGTTGIGSWTGSAASAVRVATPPAPSGGTLSVNPTVSGYPFVSTGSAEVAATPGSVYRATALVQAAATPASYAPYLVFYDVARAPIATVKGQVSTDQVGTWRPTVPVVALAPTGTAYVGIRLLWAAAAGDVHYVAQPALTLRGGGSARVAGPLRTSGNKIYDATGHVVVLRGLHRFGFEGSIGGFGVPNNFSQAEVDAAKAWGANVVRLSVASPFWLSSSCNYDSTYQTRVDQAVQMITGKGMVALFDLHFNSTGACSAVGPQLMADSTAVAFWKSAAAHYKSNPLVAFDLYNEPHDITDAVWRNGGSVTSGGTTWTAVGMQSLYDAVRSTGAKNLVVVSGNSWANRYPSNPITGSNLVYGVHAYTCPNSPTGSDCLANPMDPSSLLNSWVAPSASVPVMVSEFGWPSATDGTYVRNVISFAEGHGWGWSAFAWDGSTLGNFALLADSGPFYEPNATGMAVLDGYAKN